jgi:hypothetical protein
MTTFVIRRGDRLPWLAYQFGFSLEDAVSVTFSAREKATGGLFIDNKPAVIANGTYEISGVSRVFTRSDGVVFYQWEEVDTATVRGISDCLFHIVWPDDLQQTRPADAFIRMQIKENF